jgi:hypothetical protein
MDFNFILKNKNALIALLLIKCTFGFSQDTYIPTNSDKYHLIDRYEIKYGTNMGLFHTSSKPYSRKDVVNMADTILADSMKLSKSDLFNLNYFREENWEHLDDSLALSKKSIFKTFYKHKADFYSVNTKHFSLHVNPVIGVSAGKDNNGSEYRYLNTRGIEIRGMISKKVGFYTFLAENQALFPTYVNDYIDFYGGVPQEGFVKRFKKGDGKDFFTTRGYFTFSPVKFINVQMGNDRNFVGNGYRSLILSDHAKDYLFVKINTKLWKFNYQNLFSQLVYDYTGKPNQIYPTKFLAFHHLSLNIGKKWNIGLFESIPFGRMNGYDLAYINPIIFYRSIEQNIGSEDNAILGMDFKGYFLKHFAVYGQVVLDEFILSNFKARNGWWGNKQALQLGMKYIDVFGIKNLDIQGEFNLVRPFTYTHIDNASSYTHYNQSLAHPLGANFKEMIGIIRYQPIPKLTATAKLISYQYGADSTNKVKHSNGGNIFRRYVDRNREFGYGLADGVRVNTMFIDFTLSYQFRYNMFIDFKQVLRNAQSDLAIYKRNTTYTSLALRINIAQRLHEF